MIGGPQPNATMAALEVAARPTPPVAQMTALHMGWAEEDTAEGSPGVVAVVERTSGESPLALMLGGSHLPTRGEPLL